MGGTTYSLDLRERVAAVAVIGTELVDVADLYKKNLVSISRYR